MQPNQMLHPHDNIHTGPRLWGEATLGPVFHQHPGMYTTAAMPQGVVHHPHPHPAHQAHLHHNPYEVTAVVPTAQMQQLVAARQAEEMRRNAKRAANRRSASTCRQRRKFLVENMAGANERMRKRVRVLSLLPDMILAMRRDGVVTYASENCRHFLQFTKEEVEGSNMFDLVESGSHSRLRRLLEENLGSVSKEAIASALRHQGTTFESLLKRAEKAKDQGDSDFFSVSGKASPPPRLSLRRSKAAADGAGSAGGSRSGGGAVDMDGSTDDWESEVATTDAEGRSGASPTRSTGNGGGNASKQRRGSAIASGSGSGSGNGGTTCEADFSSGSGGDKAKSAWAHLRPLPPTVFNTGKAVAGNGGGGGGATRRLDVGTDSSSGKAGGGGVSAGGRSSADGGANAKTNMLNVDSDLQSKINAFTSAQKDLCKLEIMRQDKKCEWYEVRSSMRLAWLKAKQMIIPVEVICSFQQMHTDSPVGSAGSIVARLQRAAAIARAMVSDSNGGGGDYLSGNSSGYGGLSGGDSNDAGSPDPGDNSNDAATPVDLDGDESSARGKDPSSGDERASEAFSSDYGGGTSSGSVSGDGNSAHNSTDGNSNGNPIRNGKRGGSGGEPSSRKKARRVSAPVPGTVVTVVPVPPRVGGVGRGFDRPPRRVRAAADEPRQREDMLVKAPLVKAPQTAVAAKPVGGVTRGTSGGRYWPAEAGGAVGVTAVGAVRVSGANPTSALAALAAAAAAAESAPSLSSAKRQALSAKKSILFRHGADSQSEAGQR